MFSGSEDVTLWGGFTPKKDLWTQFVRDADK